LVAFPAHAFQPDTAVLRRLFEESFARKQHEFGNADRRTAQAARDLGGFLLTLHDTPGASKALTDALAIDEKAFGDSAAQTLEDAATLASVSPPAKAQVLLRRACESPDPTVAGPALTSLATIRIGAGDRAGAAALLTRAVEKAEQIDGKTGTVVALVLNQLASVVDAKEAVPVLQRALDIDKQALGPQHPQTLQDVRRLSTALRQTGRIAEAAQLEAQFKTVAH
jgi:hypothetical protein